MHVPYLGQVPLHWAAGSTWLFHYVSSLANSYPFLLGPDSKEVKELALHMAIPGWKETKQTKRNQKQRKVNHRARDVVPGWNQRSSQVQYLVPQTLIGETPQPRVSLSISNAWPPNKNKSKNELFLFCLILFSSFPENNPQEMGLWTGRTYLYLFTGVLVRESIIKWDLYENLILSVQEAGIAKPVVFSG